MLAAGLLMVIALAWAGYGVMLVAVPSSCTDWVTRSFGRPAYRFILTQTAILFGLVLLLGTSGHQWFWLWSTIGVVGVLKGMFFLGAPDRYRNALLNWWCHLPGWSQRLFGCLTVALGALLIIDTIRLLS